MKRILFPNHQKFSLALTGISANNYPSYPEKKEINFSSRINQFTEKENFIKYKPSFREIEGLMEYRQSPSADAGTKEVKHLEALIKVVRLNRKHYSPKNIGVWIAASSIILMVVLTAIIRHIKTDEASHLYDTFFSIPSSALAKSPESASFDWNNAVTAYENRNFSLAKDNFALVPSGSDYSDFAIFYKGICFMAMNQFNNAIETFESLSQYSNIYIQSKYYAGLCNVKLNRMNVARVIFSELANSKELGKNASEILLKLESID